MEPSRRVIENKHTAQVEARLAFRVNAHADTRRRRRRCSVGRVLNLNKPPA
jgi:hypothetical protein